MSCCGKDKICKVEDMKIKLVKSKWGYEPGDASVNWLEQPQKQFLLNNKYAEIDYDESEKQQQQSDTVEPIEEDKAGTDSGANKKRVRRNKNDGSGSDSTSSQAESGEES